MDLVLRDLLAEAAGHADVRLLAWAGAPLPLFKPARHDVREVREGFECGLSVENYNDLKAGDVIECYRTEEFARTLESTSKA